MADESQPPRQALQEWWASDEQKLARRYSWLGVGIAVLLVGTASALTALAIYQGHNGSYNVRVPYLSGAAGALLLSILSVLVAVVQYTSTKASYIEYWQRAEVHNAINAIGDVPLRALAGLNQRRMDQYQELTLSQAADAWRSAQLAMAAGLLVLVAAVAVGLAVASGTAEKAIVGSLAGISTALSGYVASTFLSARQQSLNQLNYYYVQPLRISYLLTAERLADKIGGDPALMAEVWRAFVNEVVRHAFDPVPPTGGKPTGSEFSTGPTP